MSVPGNGHGYGYGWNNGNGHGWSHGWGSGNQNVSGGISDMLGNAVPESLNIGKQGRVIALATIGLVCLAAAIIKVVSWLRASGPSQLVHEAAMHSIDTCAMGGTPQNLGNKVRSVSADDPPSYAAAMAMSAQALTII